MFEAKTITLDEIRPLAEKRRARGWRLVTQTVTDLGGDDGFDIIFHYDKDLVEKNYRVQVPRGTVIPSISGIYFAALLIENENRDLFGLEYDGLIVDFNRTLYLEESGAPLTAPFCKISTFSKPHCEV